MQDELERHELPIQSVYERNQDCTATVPVHLEILKLPEDVRTDLSTIVNAKDTVRDWYNRDMEHYLRILREDGQMLPHLEGYERFDDSWVLEGKPDDNGFLTLDWKEKDQIHSIKFSPVPVALYNQHNERGEFYLSQFAVGETFIELVYRRLLEPEIVFMSPEKMRRYGNENDVAKIDEKRGVAEVMGDAFCSGYKPNMAMTLLLRDFAVYYLNNLLGIAKERIQSN